MTPPTTTRKRPRKCSRRVFTGCANCRKRHVRCDENTPSCFNCKRLSLACDYENDKSCGKFMFKTVYPQPTSLEHEAPVSESPVPTPSVDEEVDVAHSSPGKTPTSISIVNDGDDSDPFADAEWIIPDIPDFPMEFLNGPPEHLQQSPSNSLSISSPIPSSLVPREALYYVHFLTDVSTILIIYDTPSNSNPYRLLPRLADSSSLIQDTMIALGAMHIANLQTTSDKATHFRKAMEVYGSVITRLRDILSTQGATPGLEPLATSLLLCMFEKMYATDCTWKVHLDGARRILEALYKPRPLAITSGEQNPSQETTLVRPMRRFLASLMAYLDVAAACATGEGTLIAGDYWETWGGGWEYNLGAPSFHPTRTPAERALAQIRHAWSRVMSIQAEISAFAKQQASGNLDDARRIMIHDDLAHRITNWHASAPDVFIRLDKEDEDDIDESEQECQLLSGAACIETYIMGCSIYLDRVSTQKLGRVTDEPQIAAAVDRILTLTLRFSDGLDRMAYLWPLFTAGTATNDDSHKTIISEALTKMKSFGFKHISRALEILEFVWLQTKLFGEADFNAFQQLASTALLP